MNTGKLFNQIKERRAKRTRAKLFGTSLRPRLTVFRSNKFTSVQLIDDENRKTLASATTKDIKAEKTTNTKVNAAQAIGEAIAKKAKDLKVEAVIFDRGSYRYHGRVKAVADGARNGGLKI